MNTLRSTITLLVCFFIIAAKPCISYSASIVEDESPEQVKSAFIINFIKFIDWPEEKMQSADQTFCLGMIGRDPIKETLKSFENQTAKGRRIIFRQFQNLTEIENCHVLYISPSIKHRAAKIIEHIRGRSVLTISHYEGFDEDGGILHFLITENKFQFIINYDIAQSENLKISSKLLNLAIISKAKPRENNKDW